MEIFEQAYRDGPPPWEIGRAQREFVALEETGEIAGDVLDVGCGTGENALFLAGRGHMVRGVDAVPAAIERARQKAEERGIAATFQVADALDLTALGRTFETVIDSGLFHALSDDDRPRFVRSLAAVLSPGGTYFMLAISDLDTGGPAVLRVTQPEIRAAFAEGWHVNWIRPAAFESRVRPGAPSRAWLSSITDKGEGTPR